MCYAPHILCPKADCRTAAGGRNAFYTQQRVTLSCLCKATDAPTRVCDKIGLKSPWQDHLQPLAPHAHAMMARLPCPMYRHLSREHPHSPKSLMLRATQTRNDDSTKNIKINGYIACQQVAIVTFGSLHVGRPSAPSSLTPVVQTSWLAASATQCMPPAAA